MRTAFSGLILSLSLQLFLLHGSSKADLIVNGSFEEGDYSPVVNGSYVRVSTGETKLTGWTIGGAGIDWHQNSFEIQSAFDGQKMVNLNLNGGGQGDTGILSQSFATTIGEEYILTFHLAGPSTSFPDPRQVKADIAGIDQIFSQAASDNLALIWGEEALAFTAIETSTTLQFSSVGGLGFWGPFLDQVSVVPASVPEPSGIVVLGVGTIGLLSHRWWRRRDHA